jgi:hypothetical protein
MWRSIKSFLGFNDGMLSLEEVLFHEDAEYERLHGAENRRQMELLYSIEVPVNKNLFTSAETRLDSHGVTFAGNLHILT